MFCCKTVKYDSVLSRNVKIRYFVSRNVNIRYFLSRNVKIRAMSRKKCHKLRSEPTPDFNQPWPQVKSSDATSSSNVSTWFLRFKPDDCLLLQSSLSLSRRGWWGEPPSLICKCCSQGSHRRNTEKNNILNPLKHRYAKLRISQPIIWRASSNPDYRLGWCWCRDWSWRCRGKNCRGWHFGVGPLLCHRFWPDPRQDLKNTKYSMSHMFGSHPWKAWQPKEEAMLVVHKADRCYTTARNYWKNWTQYQ